MFYLQTMDGDESWEKLLDLGLDRLKLLQTRGSILDMNETAYNEISELAQQPGSYSDSVSHSLLLVLAAANRNLRELIIEQETSLFQFRLEVEMESAQIVKAFVDLKHGLNNLIVAKHSYFSKQFNAVSVILENKYLQHYLAKHRLSKDTNGYSSFSQSKCKPVKVLLPFELAPRLVAKREVTLDRGLIVFRCHNFVELLKLLFRSLLEARILKLSKSPDFYVKKVLDGQVEDARILQLFNRLANAVTPSSSLSTSKFSKIASKVRASDIKSIQSTFPPCMKHIYSKLEQGTKLKHMQRYQFSLFLKEIGLGMKEAHTFWSMHYGKIGGEGGRTSLWHSRQGKYEYGIRHMYGQAGGRKDYRAASCATLHGQSICSFPDIEDLNLLTRSNNAHHSRTDSLHTVVCRMKEGIELDNVIKRPLDVFLLKSKG